MPATPYCWRHAAKWRRTRIRPRCAAASASVAQSSASASTTRASIHASSSHKHDELPPLTVGDALSVSVTAARLVYARQLEAVAAAHALTARRSAVTLHIRCTHIRYTQGIHRRRYWYCCCYCCCRHAACDWFQLMPDGSLAFIRLLWKTIPRRGNTVIAREIW